MKNNELQKITALGVVIFSFLSILIYAAIVALFGVATSILVLRTSLPDLTLKIGSILANAVGLVVSVSLLTAAGKVRGIVSSLIMTVVVLAIKVGGNLLFDMGNYFNWNGFAGAVFVIVFSLIGGVVGSAIKER